jgi:hypothetical protein
MIPDNAIRPVVQRFRGRSPAAGRGCGPFAQPSIGGSPTDWGPTLMNCRWRIGRQSAAEADRTYFSRGGRTIWRPGNINFGHPEFALRVAATGYHGTDDPVGVFFVSYDRGRTWSGAYRFSGLMDGPNLEGMENTARTSYLVTGPDSCLIFMAGRKTGIQHASRLDKPFVVETTDGGATFRFVSWIVPWTDQHRAVMPSAVRTQDGKLVVALRRQNPRDDSQPCWIDAYVSADNGLTWSFLSKVGETGLQNGNPPGLAVLRDGRLACAYGNRTTRRMLARLSSDGGATWGEEIVIRDNPLGYDIGYPQLIQNAVGELVALYYFASEERLHSYIEAAIWTPPPPGDSRRTAAGRHRESITSDAVRRHIARPAPPYPARFRCPARARTRKSRAG